MQPKVCFLLLAAVATCALAVPAFPKKFDSKLHGLGKAKPSYTSYKKKFMYPLKAPEAETSYNEFSAQPTDSMVPPEEYPYLTSEGAAYGDLQPPPATSYSPDDEDEESSYVTFNPDGPKDPLLPPPVSTYAIPPPQEPAVGSDAMEFLRFMVHALPVDSSYSKYLADPNPDTMLPPEELPESSYLAYPKDAKSESLDVPAVEPKKSKAISSYSSL